MYNARGGNEFNLLPQSIRGVMRFWFRAVLPRVIDVKKDNYKTMREIESLIFGSTEKKSAFDVVVRNSNVYRVNNTQKEYATYGVDKRRHLKEGSEINFDLVIKKNYKHLDDLLIELVNVVSEFGGIGAKTSNGFGNFDIEGIKIKDLKTTKEETRKIEKENILKNTDETIKKFIKENNFNVNFTQTRFGQVADYPTLVEGQYKVYLGKKSFENYSELKDFLFFNGKPELSKVEVSDNNENKNNNKTKSKKEELKNQFADSQFSELLDALDDEELEEVDIEKPYEEPSESKGVYRLTKSALRGTDFKKMMSEFKFTPDNIKQKYREYPNAKFKDAVFGLPMNFFVPKDSEPFFFIKNTSFSLKSEEHRKTSQIKIKVYKVDERLYYKVILIKSKINNNQNDNIQLKFTGKELNKDININNNVNDFYKGLENVMKDNDLIVEGGE
jgi:CRISPR-associated protein Cmr1